MNNTILTKYSNMEMLTRIKEKYMYGTYSREFAELLAKPYINDINRKGKLVAKRHGKKYYDVTFTELMR